MGENCEKLETKSQVFSRCENRSNALKRGVLVDGEVETGDGVFHRAGGWRARHRELLLAILMPLLLS